ncbi:MAG: O-methyltransferase [Acidobacteriales bacterium]|nr:MAG: O-methyltransferase [Terriglobales bacterium]
MTPLNYARVQKYLMGLVPPRNREMAAMERYSARTGFPIIGPAAGNYCYQVARLVGARSVFELGSGYGYSTAWFARAVKENGGGIVHHTVWDAELSRRARTHLGRLGLRGLVEFHVAEAVQTLHQQRRVFDLIFCDIEKRDYPTALPVIKRKLRRGGVLIIDNMLWGGRIFVGRDRSADTQGVRRFTKAIASDPDWTVTVVPIRDGLIVAHRKPAA